jgi:hypothetical protein
MRRRDMDEDELPNSGLSGWAGFQLGQMFAEHRRSSAETVSTLLHGRRNASALQALQVQVQALAAENARLRHSLTEYKLNYEELLRWSDGAEKTIKELRKKTG